MPTRRQTTIGLLSLALGSAAISSAAFSSSTAAGADIRVVVSSELTLTPARDPTAYQYGNGQHVIVDEDGEVTEIVLKRLNQRSESTFANLITVTNNGDVAYDRLAFEFVTTADSPSEASLAAADSLDVIASDLETTTDEDGRTVLLAGADASLEPGEAVTFGIVVELLPSSSDDMQTLPDNPNIDLQITAERDTN